MAPSLFKIVLVLVVLFAFLRGGRDERIVALLCFAGTAATMLFLSPLGERFAAMEIGVLMIDVAMLAGFVAVALRSYRFWPLWVAGLQLTTICGHALLLELPDPAHPGGRDMAQPQPAQGRALHRNAGLACSRKRPSLLVVERR